MPEQLDDVEGWRNFVYELFVTEGWSHLAQRYNLQAGKLVTKQCLVGDVERLQQAMRASAESGTEAAAAAAAEQLKGLDWLKKLVQEHVQGKGEKKPFIFIDDADLVEKEPGDIGEHLAFEIGQSIVWSQQMCPAKRRALRRPATTMATSTRRRRRSRRSSSRSCTPRTNWTVRVRCAPIELVDPQPDGRKVDADEGSRDGPRPSGDSSWR